jgi:hypothetical protein
MPRIFYHSIENPPKPETWRIVLDLWDLEILMWCPNGHKMKHNVSGMNGSTTLVIHYRCVYCDFKDIVYLVSEKPNMVGKDIRPGDLVSVKGEEDRGWGLVRDINQLGGDVRISFFSYWENFPGGLHTVYDIWKSPMCLTVIMRDHKAFLGN